MNNAATCAVCGGEIVCRKQGMVAPFLARRIWDRPAFPAQLMECRECTFQFFNPRLEEAEESRLYAQYRSEEYRSARQTAEPWYTRKFNSALSHPDLMRSRRESLSAILQRYLAGHKIRTVLDFGGDRGALVHGLIDGAEPFVYDISGVEPEPGVARASGPHEYDLIINSNVLEHVAYPRTLLEQIRGIASPHTKIFIEVPFESPLDANLIVRRLAQTGILMALRPSIGLTLARPRGLCLMHEHVNFYNSKSLEALMKSGGWTVEASGSYRVGGPGGGGTMGWCLSSVSSPVATTRRTTSGNCGSG